MLILKKAVQIITHFYISMQMNHLKIFPET